MNIVKYKEFMRNDFVAEYKCEYCGRTVEAWGYNDDNFHDNVIPNAKCDKCGKSTNEVEPYAILRKTGFQKRIDKLESEAK